MVEVRDVRDEAELTRERVQDAEERERIGTPGTGDDDRARFEDRMRGDELAHSPLDGG